MKLKPIIFFLVLFGFLAGSFDSNAQNTDTIPPVKDTVIKKKDTTKSKISDTISSLIKDTSKPRKKDSLPQADRINKEDTSTQTERVHTVPASPARSISAQPIGDSSANSTQLIDSSELVPFRETTSSDSVLFNTNKTTDNILAANKMINTRDQGTYFLQEIRTPLGKEFIFYLLCILLFILALFKTFYSMYFNNLFRIFFNTSLRQTQLTDQLSQAKLPSFILNIFFAISGGIYIWLLFTHFNKVPSVKTQTLLLICVLTVASIYLVKFIILKFTGWLAGIQKTVDSYIFVIFLVNKIMGVLLIPFLILLAFSKNEWIPFVAVISALFIGLIFLSRYTKSYGALDNKLSLNSLHLLIFVLGAEIIPLFVFYKVAIDYLI